MERYLTICGNKLRPYLVPLAIVTAILFATSVANLFEGYKAAGLLSVLVMLWCGSASLVIYFYSVIGAEKLSFFMRRYSMLFLGFWYVILSLITVLVLFNMVF